MKPNKAMKLEKSFAMDIANIFMNAERFMWDHAFVLAAIKKNIYENEDYKKLPRYSKTFIGGVMHHCWYLHNKLTVFSYEVNGKRLPIGSEEYRKVSPHDIHTLWSHTGASVYKSDPTKIWFSNPNRQNHFDFTV